MDELRKEHYIAEHPLAKLVHEHLALEFAVKELQVKHAETKQQLALVEEKADRALEDQFNGNYWYVIPWTRAHGVRVPGSYEPTVGIEISQIAQEFGGDPNPFPKRVHMGFDTNRYSVPFMDKIGRVWIRRNFVKESRRGWFRNGS